MKIFSGNTHEIDQQTLKIRQGTRVNKIRRYSNLNFALYNVIY